MGLLFDAAVAWSNLHSTTYKLLLGRKRTWSDSFSLSFYPEDFPHLAGMQYATDVDFGLNRAEIYSGKFISKIINREVDDEIIEKSAEWETKIQGRLECIIAMEDALDNEFLICKFDSRSVPYGSNIVAKYVIKNLRTGITFFVFVDENEQRWFCRSIFQLNIADYTKNQTHVTVLKKEKWKDGSIVIDFTHPNYKPEE